jgi:hypothetical protein
MVSNKPLISSLSLTKKEDTMKALPSIILLLVLGLFVPLFVSAEHFQDVNYKIIEKNNLGTVKGNIIIGLEKKVTKEFLLKLALNLKESQPRKYEKLFIEYYLPGMTPGSGAWATSNFNPTLEAKILGTTIEEEKILNAGSKISSDEIIGEWIDESPYVGSKYTLNKKNGKIIMVRKFKDGSSSEKEMIQKNQSGRLRFEEKKGNDHQEYYLIEKNGDLGVYDSAGLISKIGAIK